MLNGGCSRKVARPHVGTSQDQVQTYADMHTCQRLAYSPTPIQDPGGVSPGRNS